MPRSETLLRIHFDDEILWSSRWNRCKKCRSCQTFHDKPSSSASTIGGVSWAKGPWNRMVFEDYPFLLGSNFAYFQGRPLKHHAGAFTSTLPQTKISPKKWWFPIGISFSSGLFSGDMLLLVSGRGIPRVNLGPRFPWLSFPSEKLARGTGTNSVLLISRRMIWIPRLGLGSTIHIIWVFPKMVVPNNHGFSY